jgi:hypothetical protein
MQKEEKGAPQFVEISLVKAKVWVHNFVLMYAM